MPASQLEVLQVTEPGVPDPAATPHFVAQPVAAPRNQSPDSCMPNKQTNMLIDSGLERDTDPEDVYICIRSGGEDNDLNDAPSQKPPPPPSSPTPPAHRTVYR